MQNKPYLIAIDGPDGSGKTTICKHLQTFMSETYGPTEVVSMLGSGPLGKHIRQVFLDSPEKLDPGVEALWLASACVETIYHTVSKLLAEGKHVILDRYVSSYYAYQCARNTNTHAETIYNDILRPLLFKKPLDLYIYCEISVETAEERIQHRGNLDNNDRFDLTIKHQIKRGFDFFYSQYDRTSHCLNCERPEFMVQKSAEHIVRQYLPNLKG